MDDFDDYEDNGLERLEGNMTTNNVKMLFSTLEVCFVGDFHLIFRESSRKQPTKSFMRPEVSL